MTDRTAPLIDEKTEFQLTRELELLISGALVFALLQAPELLDQWWLRAQVHLSGAAFGVSFAAYYVIKLASYGLIVTVTTHFLLRGLWVALLGLRAAFPGGIDESRLELGPFAQSFYRGRLATLTQLEERVDRVAASIFSFVFLFLILLGGIALWCTISGVIALTATRLMRRPDLAGPIFWALFALFVAAQTAVALLDRWSKKSELPPRVAHAGTRLFSFVYFISLGRLYAPIFFIFSTRLSRKVIMTTQVVFVYTIVAFFLVSVLSTAGVLGLDSYIFFPPNATLEQMRTSHYESMRVDAAPTAVPTIQADVITEPYVRLFLPYNPRTDNERARVLCPDVLPFRGDGVFLRSKRGRSDPRQIRAVLGCFERLYRVELDERPVPLHDALFYVHPSSRIHGRLVMIPARTLAPGKHTLTVRRTPVPSLDEGHPPAEYFIPFWR